METNEDNKKKVVDSKEHKKFNKNKDNLKIKELEEKLNIEKEKSMRIQAEMMNYTRRKDEEVSNMYKYANEDILKKLILIIDNFERALSMETDENKEFLSGFKMIYNHVLDILKENEVVEINDKDIEFDPSIHQAVMTDHVEGVNPNMVIDVLQKGYKYKDKVLRPAMVKVSN
ncbi:MAG TPA: nucleotide exchange factor GrpE [Bacilli bacterium]|nr:nucleotide exchange factor GrpE [Bacilli bacterium]HPZ23378.1 nucleotide exchange factor GrpE [Bacilli bacterium]HQC83925.1 nucleotide exchange factor GrpE [Bacilli bacterium]